MTSICSRSAIVAALLLVLVGPGCDKTEPTNTVDEQKTAPSSETDQASEPRCRVLLTYSEGAETTRSNTRTVGSHHWMDVRFGGTEHVEQGEGLVARNEDGWRIFTPRSSRQFDDGVAKMASRYWYSFTPDGTRRRLHGRMQRSPDLEPGRIADWLVERDPTKYRPGGYYTGIDSDIVGVVGDVVTIDTLTTPERLRYRTLDWNGKPLSVLEHLQEAGHAEFDTWLAAQKEEPHWGEAKRADTPMSRVGGPVFEGDGLRFAFTFDEHIVYPTKDDGTYDVPGDTPLKAPEGGWWKQPNGCAFSVVDGDIMVRTSGGSDGEPGADWNSSRLLTSITWLNPDEEVPFDKLDQRRAEAHKMAADAIGEARGQAGKGNLDKAVEALRDGLRHAGDDPALLNELGFLEFQRENMEAAQHALSLAWIHRGEPTASGADNDDLDGRILYNLGRWSESKGDTESAVTFYRRSLEHRPNETVEKRLSKLE